MSFDKIWQQLTRKEPRLKQADSKVEFTSVNLERLLRQVYEQGQSSVPRASKPGSLSFFDDMFSKPGGG